MYVCICHAFTDKAVQRELANVSGVIRVRDIHKACSGADKPQCGSCLASIREMADRHRRDTAHRKGPAVSPE